jgi:peptidoglycan hydrolase-like protein with peptidoglycan-binding domain
MVFSRTIDWSFGVAPRHHLRDLERGMSGADVKWVQAWLGGLFVDGVYGYSTQRAVRSLQQRAHLPPTGVVDAKTALAIRRSFEARFRQQPQPRAAPQPVASSGMSLLAPWWPENVPSRGVLSAP